MSKKHRELYLSYYQVLGFFPKKIEYYNMALTHRSACVRGNSGEYINNERLEFLGDAVLGAITADIVYRRHLKRDEGFLTTLRSNIVKRETLNRIALDMGLDKVMRIAGGRNIYKDNIYGNAFEALVGAIYLDKGYEKCRIFIQKVISAHMDLDKVLKKEINYKSKLQEACQRNKVEIVYNSSELNRNGNQYTFRTELLLNDVLTATAIGSSKKDSQQNAAQMALQRIKSDLFV